MEHKLIAFYEHALDASEQKEVEQWLEADPAHKKIYDDTVTIWKKSKSRHSYSLYNKEQAWERLQQQLNNNLSEIPPKKGGLVTFSWWKFSAAAASVAAVLLVFVFINKPRPGQFTAQQEHLKVSLDDHSLVTLFPHAVLLVSPDFNKRMRTVTLKGNARFDIAKNPDKPFIIHNNDMEVAVLGTSFTIQQGKDFNTVFVHSGKVKASLQEQSIIAVARQKIVRDNKTNQLKLVNITADIDEILQTQTIKVRDMRIDSLAHLLEDLYNIEVKPDATINSRKITSTYFMGSETPEQIMENIALTINASWSKEGNQYIITK
ncbi:FecR domain-containing protein [Niabella aquatica]